MSAPAIKLRPAPISTIALTAGAALPSVTPGDSALTGGLSTTMTPTSPSFSKRTRVGSGMGVSNTSNGCFAAEDDGRLRRQDAAVAVGDRGLGALDLARAAFAAELAHRLDQQEQPVHAGVAIAEPAAVGVDRQGAARGDAAALDKAAAFALLAEAEVFEEQDRVDREGVVKLDDVDIGRSEPGHGIGLAARRQGAGDGQVRHAGNVGVG